MRATCTRIQGINAISCDNVQVFFAENPTAHRDPTQILNRLWEVLVLTQPDWLSQSRRESRATSLTLGACARGVITVAVLFVCLQACYQSTACLRRLCNKVNIPTCFFQNSQDFQLRYFAKVNAFFHELQLYSFLVHVCMWVSISSTS